MLARIRTSLPLPLHPVTGVQALGIVNGRAVYPVRGGATDDDESGDDDAGSEDDSDSVDDDKAGDDESDDDKPLGPRGEKALQAEKEKRRAAQTQLREWKALGLSPAQVQAKLKAVPADGGKDGDKPVDRDAIRAEVQAEVDAERNRDRVLDKIEAKAARAFADPDDAAALLLRTGDVNDFLDENGKVDVEAIEDGLKALLEKKPYLGIAQGDGKRFKGSGDGGARKEQKPRAASLQEAVTARVVGGQK